VRDVKRPEPYLGKGIKYQDEVIRRKQGKKAANNSLRMTTARNLKDRYAQAPPHAHPREDLRHG
jgi:hypothetical protein